jgi:Rad3-related DNA helicase
MFSAELTQQAVRNLRRSVRSDLPGLHRSLGRLNRWLLAERKAAEVAGGEHWRPEAPAGMEPLLRSVLIQAERILARNEKTSWREPLLEFYFEGTNFLRVMEGYDASYATCLRAEERSLRIKLFCVDPAARMREAIGRARTVVFYSATLAPPAYFLNMFGCAQETPVLRLPSPYPPERLHLLIDDRTSTFFRERDATGPRVADAIHALVSGRRGNYLCFFPAYKYMDDVHEMFRALHPEWTTLVQNPEMTEEERERFLSRFDQENPETLVGFAVMGGIFGEGIDLVGDRLSGAVVVGVGLPGLCAERDLIRSFFDEKLASGFEYAYQYPGMNRVLQAVGRVIRSDEDRGVVLLIDCRYRTARYRDLFPREWRPVTASEPGVIAGTVAAFWARHR